MLRSVKLNDFNGALMLQARQCITKFVLKYITTAQLQVRQYSNLKDIDL